MNITQELKDKIKTALPDLDVVIGWRRGYDPLHATPHFIYREEEIDALEAGPLSVHNLAVYLPDLRGKKVGIVVKGCDSRSVVELLQENLIDREAVTIFGYPCTGVVDHNKIRTALGGTSRITACAITQSALQIDCGSTPHTLPFSDIMADKCAVCRYPNAVISDHFCGDKIPTPEAGQTSRKLAEFEELDLPGRLNFWTQEMDRCIRCYACRNACPLCVCRDHCAAESRDPHWLSQENSVRDKLLFQVIHAYHLAGRCTECGECQRACPMDIPILLLKQKMNQEIENIFHYEAGIDPGSTPPLLSFKHEEDTIRERKW